MQSRASPSLSRDVDAEHSTAPHHHHILYTSLSRDVGMTGWRGCTIYYYILSTASPGCRGEEQEDGEVPYHILYTSPSPAASGMWRRGCRDGAHTLHTTST
jgi:hypothetical protein